MLGANGDVVSYNLFAYCEDSPTNRTDDGGHFSNILIGAIVGAVIGGFSSAVRGGSFKEVVISAAAGAVSGAFCAMGFWGVLAGSTINGVVTAISSDGSTAEKVIRGSIAFGSTLFWGSYGNGLTKAAGDGLIENLTFDMLFGSVAEIVNEVSQDEAIRTYNRKSEAERAKYDAIIEDMLEGAMLIV